MLFNFFKSFHNFQSPQWCFNQNQEPNLKVWLNWSLIQILIGVLWSSLTSLQRQTFYSVLYTPQIFLSGNESFSLKNLSLLNTCLLLRNCSKISLSTGFPSENDVLLSTATTTSISSPLQYNCCVCWSICLVIYYLICSLKSN